MTRYNWVGCYLFDPAYSGQLHAQRGIPLNTGLCGAAASSGQNVVVHGVSKDPPYLAASTLVKSEIVIRIYVNKTLAGELDIESYFADSFNKSEQKFAQASANMIADCSTVLAPLLLWTNSRSGCTSRRVSIGPHRDFASLDAIILFD
jgi:L-methionine (R)-S-oxide reductase